MLLSRFVSELIALAGSGLIFVQSARGQAAIEQFLFKDYLLAPVRVHLLSANDSPIIQTTLTGTDVVRILGKLNGVWAQAGLHFYLESVVGEEASHQPTYTKPATDGDRSALLELRPTGSVATNMFH